MEEELTEEDFEVSEYDLAEFLETKEDIRAAFDVAFMENHTSFLFEILDALPRAEGTPQLARELNLTRAELLEKGSAGILNILGYQVRLEPKSA